MSHFIAVRVITAFAVLTEQQHLNLIAHLHPVATKLVLNGLIAAAAFLIVLADAATHYGNML